MLYYRLYKKMKRNFGYDSGVFVPLDYGLFAIIIPMIVGSAIGKALQSLLGIDEAYAFLFMVLLVITAAVYIQVCEKRDQEP